MGCAVVVVMMASFSAAFWKVTLVGWSVYVLYIEG